MVHRVLQKKKECKRHKLRLWSDKGVNAYWSCQKKFKDFKNTEEYWGESPVSFLYIFYTIFASKYYFLILY